MRPTKKQQIYYCNFGGKTTKIEKKVFFDRNSFFDQYRLQSTLDELENKKEYYQQEILRDEESSKDLYKSDKSREKFVRENYYMKKSNEEVFIIDK